MVGLWVAINGDTVELDVGDVVGRNVLVMDVEQCHTCTVARNDDKTLSTVVNWSLTGCGRVVGSN